MDSEEELPWATASLGRLLLAGLAAITLAACSGGGDSPSADQAASAKAAFTGGDQPRPWRSGIFIEGISLQEARAKGWLRFEKYEEAAEKLPTAEACLELVRKKPALLAIDLGKIRSDVEASVCLTRVAQRIGSEKEIAEWLKAQGFRIGSI